MISNPHKHENRELEHVMFKFATEIAAFREDVENYFGAKTLLWAEVREKYRSLNNEARTRQHTRTRTRAKSGSRDSVRSRQSDPAQEEAQRLLAWNAFRFKYVAYMLLEIYSQRCQVSSQDLQDFARLSMVDGRHVKYQLSSGSFAGSTTMDSDVDVTVSWGNIIGKMKKVDAYSFFLTLHEHHFENWGSLQDMFDINVYGVGFNILVHDTLDVTPVCTITTSVIENQVVDNKHSLTYAWCKLRAHKYVPALLHSGSSAADHPAIRHGRTMTGAGKHEEAYMKMRSNELGRLQDMLQELDRAWSKLPVTANHDMLSDVDNKYNMKTAERVEQYQNIRQTYINELHANQALNVDDRLHSILSRACLLADDQYYTCSTYKFVVAGLPCNVYELYQSMWENFGFYARYVNYAMNPGKNGRVMLTKQCKYVARINKALLQMVVHLSGLTNAPDVSGVMGLFEEASRFEASRTNGKAKDGSVLPVDVPFMKVFKCMMAVDEFVQRAPPVRGSSFPDRPPHHSLLAHHPSTVRQYTRTESNTLPKALPRSTTRRYTRTRSRMYDDV
jgi:hypothetical protein